MALNAADILKFSGVYKTVEVHVPEWAKDSGDDVVLVRGLTAREFELAGGTAKEGEAMAKQVAACALDDAGARIFSKDQVTALAEVQLKALMRVNEAILRESGLLDEDGKKKDEDEAVEEAGNDSGSTPGVEPSSSSPSDSGAQPTN